MERKEFNREPFRFEEEGEEEGVRVVGIWREGVEVEEEGEEEEEEEWKRLGEGRKEGK